MDGYSVVTWLTGDPTCVLKARLVFWCFSVTDHYILKLNNFRCLLCPPKLGESHRSFSIAEGFTAVT